MKRPAYCVCVSFFFRSVFLWLLAFLLDLVHYSRDSQTSFINKTFIKNWSHGIVHIFKNYFATVFSVFNFQQNKQYPNTPIVSQEIVWQALCWSESPHKNLRFNLSISWQICLWRRVVCFEKIGMVFEVDLIKVTHPAIERNFDCHLLFCDESYLQ